MTEQYERIQKTCAQLQDEFDASPEVGLVLGTGLTQLLEDEFEQMVAVPYDQINGFRVSTTVGHSGKLVFGKLASKSVVVMEGRLHGYEGYSAKETTFPIRVMAAL